VVFLFSLDQFTVGVSTKYP